MFTEDDIAEQIRLFKAHEDGKRQPTIFHQQDERGDFRVYFIANKMKEISYKEFASYNSAFEEFNRMTNSRVLTKEFEVITSRSVSKKSKHDITKLKNYINTAK